MPELRRRGVEAIVILAHAGGPTQDATDARDYAGEIIDEARQMSSAVDVVVAGHSHSRMDVRVPNADSSGDKLIVEALSYGVAYDRVDISSTAARVRWSPSLPRSPAPSMRASRPTPAWRRSSRATANAWRRLPTTWSA